MGVFLLLNEILAKNFRLLSITVTLYEEAKPVYALHVETLNRPGSRQTTPWQAGTDYPC